MRHNVLKIALCAFYRRENLSITCLDIQRSKYSDLLLCYYISSLVNVGYSVFISVLKCKLNVYSCKMQAKDKTFAMWWRILFSCLAMQNYSKNRYSVMRTIWFFTHELLTNYQNWEMIMESISCQLYTLWYRFFRKIEYLKFSIN